MRTIALAEAVWPSGFNSALVRVLAFYWQWHGASRKNGLLYAETYLDMIGLLSCVCAMNRQSRDETLGAEGEGRGARLCAVPGGEADCCSAVRCRALSLTEVRTSEPR